MLLHWLIVVASTAAHAKPGMTLRLTPNCHPHPHPDQRSSWGYQVRHVQRMVNDAPTTALGGMARSESLFGAPSMTAKLPSAETIIKLLGFTK